MDHDYLIKLRQHPTWRLLCADNAPLIISFFYRVFIAPNSRSLRQNDLTEKLTDTLFHLRQIHGDKAYPKTANAYLNDWTSGDNAFLRKYLPPQGDEPEYDLTPASEKAISWLYSLEQKQFIGTESRLLAVFELLENILQATQTDPEQRIAELQHQKAAIDEEITSLQHGAVISYEPRQIRERFQLLQETARSLLMDFRQVEENFRQLDRHTREKIALSNKSKGELLDDIFGEHDAIGDSDQGKSFRAFWDLLMSPAKQEKFNQLIQDVLALPDVQMSTPDELLPKMKYHLLEAGEKVQRTSSSLVEQLRRYLDDQVWLENKRIMSIIHDLEKNAIAVKQNPPTARDFMLLDDTKAQIKLPLSQPLFRMPNRSKMNNEALTTGTAEFVSELFYQQHHVDVSVLQARIQKALQTQTQISLEVMCQQYPLEKGLSELVAYLHLACEDNNAIVDAEQEVTIHWQNDDGVAKFATMPKVIFTR
jgi:flagellar motility protein MotE (MotC chaperone)